MLHNFVFWLTMAPPYQNTQNLRSIYVTSSFFLYDSELMFQKHLGALLQEHHEEMMDHSKVMYKLRMDTINRLYKDPALTRRLSKLSEEESTELYTTGLIRHKRNTRLGDKRPLS